MATCAGFTAATWRVGACGKFVQAPSTSLHPLCMADILAFSVCVCGCGCGCGCCFCVGAALLVHYQYSSYCSASNMYVRMAACSSLRYAANDSTILTIGCNGMHECIRASRQDVFHCGRQCAWEHVNQVSSVANVLCSIDVAQHSSACHSSAHTGFPGIPYVRNCCEWQEPQHFPLPQRSQSYSSNLQHMAPHSHSQHDHLVEQPSTTRHIHKSACIPQACQRPIFLYLPCMLTAAPTNTRISTPEPTQTSPGPPPPRPGLHLHQAASAGVCQQPQLLQWLYCEVQWLHQMEAGRLRSVPQPVSLLPSPPGTLRLAPCPCLLQRPCSLEPCCWCSPHILS
jgi:hypothetical protein